MTVIYAIAGGVLVAVGQYFMKRLSGLVSLDLASLRLALSTPYTYAFLVANFTASIFYVLALRGESMIYVFSIVYVTMAVTTGAIDLIVFGSVLTPARLLGFALALVSVGLLIRS